MSKITLDFLEPSVNRNNTEVFKDLKLDLMIGRTYNTELNKKGQIIDIITSNNLDAIRNSLINLLTTSPGEKILNPLFGINFGDLLFLPVSKIRAEVVGEAIADNINRFEPRLEIINLNVNANIEKQEYEIELAFYIPRFENQPLKINGTLNKTGFYASN